MPFNTPDDQDPSSQLKLARALSQIGQNAQGEGPAVPSDATIQSLAAKVAARPDTSSDQPSIPFAPAGPSPKNLSDQTIGEWHAPMKAPVVEQNENDENDQRLTLPSNPKAPSLADRGNQPTSAGDQIDATRKLAGFGQVGNYYSGPNKPEVPIYGPEFNQEGLQASDSLTPSTPPALKLSRGNKIFDTLSQLTGLGGGAPKPGQPYTGPQSLAQKFAAVMKLAGGIGGAGALAMGTPQQKQIAGQMIEQNKQLAVQQQENQARLAQAQAQLQSESNYHTAMIENQKDRIKQGYDLAMQRYGPDSVQAQKVQAYMHQNGMKLDDNGQVVSMSGEEIAKDPFLSSKLAHSKEMADYLAARTEFTKSQGPIQIAKLQQAEQRLQLAAQHEATYAQSVQNANTRFYGGLDARGLQARIQNNERQKQQLLKAKQNPQIMAQLEGASSPEEIDAQIAQLDQDSQGAYQALGQLTGAPPASHGAAPPQKAVTSQQLQQYAQQHGMSVQQAQQLFQQKGYKVSQ